MQAQAMGNTHLTAVVEAVQRATHVQVHVQAARASQDDGRWVWLLILITVVVGTEGWMWMKRKIIRNKHNNNQPWRKDRL